MAKKPGRRSAASLTVVPFDTARTRPRIPAPSILNPTENALFVASVSNNPHLTIADAPFLATYVQALAKTYTRTNNRCSKRKGVGDDSARDDFDDMKLRPTSHSQTHPEKAGRARNNATPPSYYDLQQEHSDD